MQFWCVINSRVFINGHALIGPRVMISPLLPREPGPGGSITEFGTGQEASPNEVEHRRPEMLRNIWKRSRVRYSRVPHELLSMFLISPQDMDPSRNLSGTAVKGQSKNTNRNPMSIRTTALLVSAILIMIAHVEAQIILIWYLETKLYHGA